MAELTEYEQKLLQGWEDVHNKGQLSLWILLALKDGSKHMSHIKEFIARMTNHILVPDDKSVYRALRRFKASELVSFKLVPSSAGPDLKIYELTCTGSTVLQAFLRRNIDGILYQPRVLKLIQGK